MYVLLLCTRSCFCTSHLIVVACAMKDEFTAAKSRIYIVEK